MCFAFGRGEVAFGEQEKSEMGVAASDAGNVVFPFANNALSERGNTNPGI